MSETAKPVTINVLDKEYTVACTESEQQSLMNSAEYLNGKIKEVRSNGKVSGNERVVVMAALNIVHEYLECKAQHDGMTGDVMDIFSRINGKVDEALESSGSAT